ncbi:MAG TPA: excalibur calcium-binding domain-containing protein [Kineosporiaceae bacterium]|nr:excalibur calcium-binding domain-containing protein [Kineosporiaceae bacterium]
MTVTAQAQGLVGGGGGSGGGGSVYYANCSAARAAGDTPLYRGDPGYRPGLDRDGDGVACE